MAQRHDHIISSASDVEANGRITSGTTDHVHQREWELESVNSSGEASDCKEGKVSDGKVLVIMAGNDRPTFLATPMCRWRLRLGGCPIRSLPQCRWFVD